MATKETQNDHKMTKYEVTALFVVVFQSGGPIQEEWGGFYQSLHRCPLNQLVNLNIFTAGWFLTGLTDSKSQENSSLITWPFQSKSPRCCLTSSHEAVGCYSRGRQTSDGGDHSGHQNDGKGQSCNQKRDITDDYNETTVVIHINSTSPTDCVCFMAYSGC